MFRCTDCGKEYTINPGYCEDCGNDQFEEIQTVAGNGYDDYSDDGYSDEEYYDDYNNQQQYQVNYITPQRNIKGKSKKAPAKKKGMSKSDQVGIGVFSVCLILGLVILISGFTGGSKKPSSKNNGDKPLLTKNYTIPNDINSIWDSTPPSGKPNSLKTPDKIINARINELDPELKKYLAELLDDMVSNWNRSGIEGNGIAQMEFKLNPIGALDSKKLTRISGNTSLDSSVDALMKEYNTYVAPPSSYKQEYIIISFSSKNGTLKAYFPKVTIK